MPIIKSAIKKLRKDRRRTAVNKKRKETLKEAIKKTRRSPTEANVKAAQKLLDKAAKTNLVHKNKAARLKSKLAKLLSKKTGKVALSSKKARAIKPTKIKKKPS